MKFTPHPKTVQVEIHTDLEIDLISAILDRFHVYSIEPLSNSSLNAYWEENQWKEIKSSLQLEMERHPCSIQKVEFINYQNWNRKWEESYAPVQIGDFCQIRAEFHPPDQNFRHDIIIDPKMAFGTGHHPTTSAMIHFLEALDIGGKTVLDLGAGTGVLGIIAEREGARSVLAIDNDPAACENMWENIVRNHCDRIETFNGTLEELGPANANAFDMILANINRKVLIEAADQLHLFAKKGSDLVLSGILKKDIETIESYYKDNWKKINTFTSEDWVAIHFQHE